MTDTSFATTDSKPNGPLGQDPTGAQASAAAAQASDAAATDVNMKSDALQLVTADLDMVKAKAAQQLAVQTAQAKANKAIADAKAATAVKKKAWDPLNEKLTNDTANLALELAKKEEAAKAATSQKKELDGKVSDYEKATKAQLAAKVEVDAAQKSLTDAQSAKTDADAAWAKADSDVVASQQAYDTADADLKAAQTLQDTAEAQAKAQLAVEIAQADSIAATANAAAAKKRYDVLKAAKERKD